MIGQLAAAGRNEEIAGRSAPSSRHRPHAEAGARHPGPVAADAGDRARFEAAIGDLVVFWRARQPDIAFDVALTVEEAGLSDAMLETLYRVVQEGLCNAVRHARPGRIKIIVGADGGGQLIARVRDDGGAPARPAKSRASAWPACASGSRRCGGALAVERRAGGWWVAGAPQLAASEREAAVPA